MSYWYTDETNAYRSGDNCDAKSPSFFTRNRLTGGELLRLERGEQHLHPRGLLGSIPCDWTRGTRCPRPGRAPFVPELLRLRPVGM